MSIRVDGIRKTFGGFAALDDISLNVPQGELVGLLGPSGSGKTTLLRIIAGLEKPDRGRVLFNELLPPTYAFVNEQMHKKVQARIINDLAERFPMIVVAQTVDKLKDAGFFWATRSGVTVSMADVLVPPQKQEILDRYETEADGIEKKYQRGALNHDERNEALVKIWQDATEEVGEALRAHVLQSKSQQKHDAEKHGARKLEADRVRGCVARSHIYFCQLLEPFQCILSIG